MRLSRRLGLVSVRGWSKFTILIVCLFVTAFFWGFYVRTFSKIDTTSFNNGPIPNYLVDVPDSGVMAVDESYQKPEESLSVKLEDIILSNSFNTLHSIKDSHENYRYDRPWKTPKHTFLDVVFMPFSHIDPGWGMTVDGYYNARVKRIFNAVFPSMAANPKERFLVAEMVYLKRWYDEAPPGDKKMLVKLVKNGQLEIGTGGWVMPDEAVTHFPAVVDQMIYGHRWVKETFNIVPKYGFANDPFGHSPTFAYLAKKAGLKGMFINRIHQYVKRWFAEHGQQDFLWQQAWDDSHKSDITTHLMAMHDYDLDHQCSTNLNVCKKYDFSKKSLTTDVEFQTVAKEIAAGYRNLSTLFPTDTLLVIFGRDFHFDRNGVWQRQLEHRNKIHEIINSNPQEYKMKIRMGTLTDYFQAVEKEIESSQGRKQLMSVSGDFFTYSDIWKTYWSGFYTSRAFSKYMVRLLQRKLFAGDILLVQLLATKNMQSGQELALLVSNLTKAREELGIFQHHDAITGTSNDRTTADYLRRLRGALGETESVLEHLPKYFSNLNSDSTGKLMLIKDDENQTIASTEGFPEFLHLTVFNPTPYNRTELIKVIAQSPCWQAEDRRMLQVNPIFTLKGTVETDKYEILVHVTSKPFEYQRVVLRSVSCDRIEDQLPQIIVIGERMAVPPPIFRELSQVVDKGDFHRLSPITARNNKGTTVTFNPITHSIAIDSGDLKASVEIEAIEYQVKAGGPYIFEPREGKAKKIIDNDNCFIVALIGSLRSEVRCLGKVHQHTWSMCNYNSDDCSSVNLQVKTDVKGMMNREVGIRLKTSIENHGTLYTDLNGFQMSRRNFTNNIPLEGNFYPMTSSAYIQDSEKRITILSQEPHAVASLDSGEVQIILDRVLKQDDRKGIGQGVRDTIPVTNTFKILLEKTPETEKTSPRVSKLTGLSAVTNEILQTQTLSWISAKHSELKPPFMSPPTIACQYSIVGLRYVPSASADLKPDKAILTLRRHVFPGSDVQSTTFCLLDKDTFGVSSVLPVTAVKEMHLTSLTSVEHVHKVDPQNGIEIQPHHIETYVIDLVK